MSSSFMRTVTGRVFLVVAAFFVVAFFLLVAVPPSPSPHKPHPEHKAIMGVIGGLKLYEVLNEGRSATNWLQLSEILELDSINQGLRTRGYGPLDQNYVFVQQKIPVPGYERGDVVLIRATPIQIKFGNKAEKGRFVISRYKGQLKFNWLPEETIQKMLAAAGVKELPKPEPLSASTNSPASTNKAGLDRLGDETGACSHTSLAAVIALIVVAAGFCAMWLWRKQRPVADK